MSKQSKNWAKVQKALAGIEGFYLHTQKQHDAMESLLVEVYGMEEGSHALGENVLAEQFVELPTGQIRKISLESGEVEDVCATFSTLREALTKSEDVNYFLANSLLADWQAASGRSLEANERLVPTTPFIGGGAFEASNLHSASREEALGFLSFIYEQVKDLPDGATLQLKVVPSTTRP